mmetsp:Transcript_39317/g.82322  ORF Transcript_39317/g.82322 Transcript_39317/m.82322 type:complete len:237 (-) Transcript_39317:26-736(-)
MLPRTFHEMTSTLSGTAASCGVNIVVTADKPYRVLKCEQNLQEILDFNSSEIVGRTLTLIFGPETNVTEVHAAIKNASLSKTTSTHAKLYGRKGNSRPFRVTCCPCEKSQGETAIGCYLQLQSENQDQSEETKATTPEQPNNSLSNAFAHEVIDRVCIAQGIHNFSATKKFRPFRPQATLQYHAFCDDFGPMDILSITTFINLLDYELASFPSCKIVMCVEQGRRALANAVFLLGA